MTIGILCAIPQEHAQLVDELTNPSPQTIAGQTYTTGQLDGHDIVLVSAGIGKSNTAIAATLLADRFKTRLIIFSGVAGGLDPALNIGDIVIADSTLQHDAGVIENEQINTYQAGHVPFFNPTDKLGYPVDPNLIKRVSQALQDIKMPTGHNGKIPTINTGRILSGDQYIHCEATRERLHSQFGGKAVEMEGGTLGQVCEAFNIPFLDIRALSDLAGQDSRFDFATFVDAAAANSATILRKILPTV